MSTKVDETKRGTRLMAENRHVSLLVDGLDSSPSHLIV